MSNVRVQPERVAPGRVSRVWACVECGVIDAQADRAGSVCPGWCGHRAEHGCARRRAVHVAACDDTACGVSVVADERRDRSGDLRALPVPDVLVGLSAEPISAAHAWMAMGVGCGFVCVTRVDKCALDLDCVVGVGWCGHVLSEPTTGVVWSGGEVQGGVGTGLTVVRTLWDLPASAGGSDRRMPFHPSPRRESCGPAGGVGAE